MIWQDIFRMAVVLLAASFGATVVLYVYPERFEPVQAGFAYLIEARDATIAAAAAMIAEMRAFASICWGEFVEVTRMGKTTKWLLAMAAILHIVVTVFHRRIVVDKQARWERLRRGDWAIIGVYLVIAGVEAHLAINGHDIVV